MTKLIVILLSIAAFGAHAQGPTPSALIANYLASPDQPGDVFAQASKADHFNYRKTLQSAAAKNRAALVTLLEYNSRTSLIGAGAESHSSILVALLNIWGDAPFSNSLKACTPKAISTAQNFLTYGGASPEQFPKTFAVLGLANAR